MSAFFLHHPRETDLALFAGGELGPLSRWRIERHIEGCEQCEQVTADFFRLPDQISELGELPEVDWNAMAEAIDGRLRAEAATAAPTPKRGYGPAVWQLGAAAACLIAVVAVMRQQPTFEPAESAAPLTEIRQEAQRQAPALSPPAEQFASAPLDEAREAEPPAQRIAKAKASTEQEQYRGVSPVAANSAAGFADRDAQIQDLRKNEKLTSDIAAPPPPASPGERAEPAAPVTARAQVKTAPTSALKRSAEGAAESAAAPQLRSDMGLARRTAVAGGRAASAPMPAAVFSLGDEADSAAMTPLRIQPPAGVQFEAVPGADGKITLRYFDPETGVLTIVDVDTP